MHKDQAMTGGRMPLWHLPIPILQKRGTCNPSLRLPAHSVPAQSGYLFKLHHCMLPQPLSFVPKLGWALAIMAGPPAQLATKCKRDRRPGHDLWPDAALAPSHSFFCMMWGLAPHP
eukprot:1159048-Pelagomonas_calceolata.AAC.8